MAQPSDSSPAAMTAAPVCFPIGTGASLIKPPRSPEFRKMQAAALHTLLILLTLIGSAASSPLAAELLKAIADRELVAL
jgi:hypothetical protein